MQSASSAQLAQPVFPPATTRTLVATLLARLPKPTLPPATHPPAHSRYQSPRLLAHCYHHHYRLAHLTLSLPPAQTSRRPTPSFPHVPSHRSTSVHLPDQHDQTANLLLKNRVVHFAFAAFSTICPPGLQPRRYTLTAIHLASQVLRTRGQSSLPCPLDCTLACNNPTATYGKPPCSLLSRCDSRI